MARYRKLSAHCAFLASLMGVAFHARAALVCAHTGDEVQAALDQIVFIGEDTTIRIVGGTYARPLWISLTEQSPIIDISCGWNPSCSARRFR